MTSREWCLCQLLRPLCAASGVGLGTMETFRGTRAVRPITAFGSQRAQHRRTNSDTCHLSPVPGPLSLKATFLECIWGTGFF